MREVIYFEELEAMESEYLKKNTRWKLEREILESFQKQELKEFIEQSEKEYMKEYMPYYHWLSRKKFREGYQELWEMGRYCIEQFSHHFEWGKELEMHKNFLEELKAYYKEQYASRWRYKREKFDVASLSIEEVISKYISLPKNLRRNLKCPLHKDKTASFRIYPDTQSFFCFGCNKGWNAVNFVSEIENITLKEAFKKLANLYTK